MHLIAFVLCKLQNCNRPARNFSYCASNIELYTLFNILAMTQRCQKPQTLIQRLRALSLHAVLTNQARGSNQTQTAQLQKEMKKLRTRADAARPLNSCTGRTPAPRCRASTQSWRGPPAQPHCLRGPTAKTYVLPGSRAGCMLCT